jgi:acetyltransferase-like isoleucine patch superfamily enzyme
MTRQYSRVGLSQKLRKAPWHLRYRTGAKLASELRKLSIRLTHQHCRVEFQGPVYLGPGFHLIIPDRGEFIVGPGVDFRRGFVCEISGNGRVTIGAGATFTSHALIQCTTSITIGKRATFGQSLMIADGSHRFGDPATHVLDQGYDFNPITIGDNAVVLSKVTIVADIGEGAFVGANSLVNKPVPPHCFAGGVPARVIRSFEDRSEHVDVDRG